MGRRRRRRGSRKVSAGLVVLVGAAASTWWLYRAERSTGAPEPPLLLATQAEPSSAAPSRNPVPSIVSAPPPTPSVASIERSVEPEPAPIETPPQPVETTPATPNRLTALTDAGRAALARGDRLSARTLWSEALRLGTDAERSTLLRTELGRLAEETILSPTVVGGDPLVERYVIRAGDVLAKVAAANKISPELLATINGIADKNLIREGQTLKLIRGPFRAVVRKSEYRLEVFLGDTFVRQYKVGLGADDSTPTGEWRVATKLVNPTYYPPRGGQIVSADDPANPLGERWIGLVGVSGEALDQQRYGIHGTNEPDSIGKNLSLGCIRMHNADVEQLYTYLVETHSTVAVLE